jgi:hypothetical protein
MATAQPEQLTTFRSATSTRDSENWCRRFSQITVQAPPIGSNEIGLRIPRAASLGARNRRLNSGRWTSDQVGTFADVQRAGATADCPSREEPSCLGRI